MNRAKEGALTVYIHVPKTAGTTINSYLSYSGSPGEAHIESWIDDDARATERLSALGWVSGHVPVARMRDGLSRNTSRPLKFYTLLRDPREQLMSHYNWLIEIFHRGDTFYNLHPSRIKEISEAVRNTDNSRPSSIVKQIEKYSDLFLNQQSRFVLSNRPSSYSDAEIESGLSIYDAITTERYIHHLVRGVSGLPYRARRKKNVSNYYFDKSVFKSDYICSFIEERHSADIAVYRFVQGKNSRELSPDMPSHFERMKNYFSLRTY